MRRNLRNSLFVSLFLMLGFLLSAVPGAAQAIFNYGSTGAVQIREEGITELVNTATLSISAIGTNGGTVPVNAGIIFVFSTSITNSALSIGALPTNNINCNTATATSCNANISVALTKTTVKNDTLTITFTAATTFTTTGSITLQGLRVNASLLTAGAFVTANVSGTSNSNTSFLQTSAQVGQVAATKSLVETLVPDLINPAITTANVLTCTPLTTDFTIDVSEAFPNALRNEADEGAGANAADTITVSITNVPNTVTLTPQDPVICPTTLNCTLTFVATPAAQTSTATAMTLAFTYTVATESLTVTEDAELEFQVSTTSTTLPTMQASPSVATVVLGPTTPTTSVPLFSGVSEPTAQNVVSWSDCVTNILLPYVTTYRGGGTAPDSNYDTGITIGNTSLDTFVIGGALAQAGTCTLNLFPSSKIGAVPYTTASIAAGGSLGITASTVPGWSNIISGYIIGTCDFQNAHTFVSVYDNAGLGSPGFQQGYVGLILPNPSTVSRNPAGGGRGESLGM